MMEEGGGEGSGRREDDGDLVLLVNSPCRGQQLLWNNRENVHRCYLWPREGGQSAPNLAVRIQNRRTLGAKRRALIFCSYLPTKDLLEEQVKA